MAGALSQVQDDGGSSYDSDRRALSMRRRSLLDRATRDMITHLQETAPMDAQAAAMFGAAPENSLPGALGRGMEAALKTRIGMVSMPYDLEQKAAYAALADARAQQTDLQNQINELNFGYLTEPYGPSRGGGAAPPSPGSAGPGGATRSQAAGPAAPPAAGGGGADGIDFADPQHLPLTPQSQSQLQALQAQLDRASQYINTAPQARADYFDILAAMSKVVQDDPLAKQALQSRQQQETSDIALDKELKLKVAELGSDAIKEAEQQLNSMMSMPNNQVNIGDPDAVNAWIDSRAHEIFATKYAMLWKQLAGAGIDPKKYLGQPPITQRELPPPDQGQPPAPPQLSVTPPPAAAPGPGLSLTPEPAPQGQPPLGAPPAAPPAPSPSSAPAGAPTAPKKSIVQPPQLSPQQKIEANVTLGAQAQSLQGFKQMEADLERALELNQHSIAGTFADAGVAFHRGKASLYELFGGHIDDPELRNTAELESIMSTQTLERLNQLIKGNPTEGERAYVERTGSVRNMTKQERQVLFERGLELLQPRIAFELMRLNALSEGRTVSPDEYENWLKTSYPNGKDLAKKRK